MNTYALQFARQDIIAEPTYSVIPADTPPAEELTNFFRVLDDAGVGHHEVSPGVYEVAPVTGQRWNVRIVTVDDLDATQPMPAAAGE